MPNTRQADLRVAYLKSDPTPTKEIVVDGFVARREGRKCI